MRRTIQTLTALITVLGAFAFFGSSASANVAQNYRNDMKGFVPGPHRLGRPDRSGRRPRGRQARRGLL